MFGWGRKKSSLTGEWAAAERVVIPFMKKNWNYSPEKVEADQAWPFMLKLDGLRSVLVHHGAVVDMRAGLDALASYLKDIKALERKPDAAAMLEIVGYYGADPPNVQPIYRIDSSRAPEALRPHVEHDASGMRLIVFYQDPPRMPPGVGSSMPSDLMNVKRCTLTITPEYRASWSAETSTIKRPNELR